MKHRTNKGLINFIKDNVIDDLLNLSTIEEELFDSLTSHVEGGPNQIIIALNMHVIPGTYVEVDKGELTFCGTVLDIIESTKEGSIVLLDLEDT